MSSSGISFTGTDGRSSRSGGILGDTLDGRGGDDRLSGFGGNDLLLGGNDSDFLSGGAGDDTLHGDSRVDGGSVTASGSGDDILLGGTGNDQIFGEGGDDYIEGNAGNDTIDGGAGFDEVGYDLNNAAPPALVVTDRDGTWEVVSGTDGTDVVSNVEVVTDGNGNRTLLVGNGGFTSIQAALDQASSGDTIAVAAGTWGAFTVAAGLANITIMGVNHATAGDEHAAGGTVINAYGSSVAADGVTIKGIRFDVVGNAEAETSALTVSGNNVTVENSVFFRTGVAMPAPAGSTGFILSTVWHHAITVSGADATIAGNLFDQAAPGPFTGSQGLGWRNGVNATGTAGTTIDVSGNTFQGGGTTAVTLNIAADTNSAASIAGNTITGYGTFTTVSVPGSVDLEALFLNNAYTGPTNNNGTFLNGNAGNDPTGINVDVATLLARGNTSSVNGGDGFILFNGGANVSPDTLTGGEGNDGLGGSGGNDVLSGGTGSDLLTGGGGVDTAVFGSPTSSAAFNVNLVAGTATSATPGEGNDTLSGIENVRTGGGADTVTGSNDANLIVTGNGNDRVDLSGDTAGAGADTVDGGDGTADVLVLGGAYADYTLSLTDTTLTITRDGVSHVVTNAERVQFSDLTVHVVDDLGVVSDVTSIATAVGNAAAGDVVLVAAGTYTEGNIALNRAITLLGANRDVAGSDAARGPASTVNGMFVLGANDITIDGFDINGGGTFQYGVRGLNTTATQSDITIVNNVMTGQTGAGLVYGFGFGGTPATDWTVTDNQVSGLVGDNKTGMVLFNISGLTLTDNVILHNGAQIGRRGINLDGIQGGTVSGNTVTMGGPAGANWGIQIGMSDRNAENLVVSGNTVTGVSSGIITLSQRDAVNVAITGNTLTNVTAGIVLNTGGTLPQVAQPEQDITVTGNAITTVATDGNAIIVLDLHNGAANGPVTFDGLQVSGNTIVQGIVRLGGIEAAGGTLLNVSGAATVEGSERGDRAELEGTGSANFDGLGGNDTFLGAAGADTVLGGEGDDSLAGNGGADVIDGGNGADAISGGADGDVLTGGAGANTLSGGEGADTLNGGDDGEVLQGDAGDDVLNGGAGADTMEGGDGVDRFVGGEGNDEFAGGDGVDTAAYDVPLASLEIAATGSGWTVTRAADDVDTLTDVEIVAGSDGRILLVGSGGFVSLQAALAEAEEGDVIRLASGTYTGDVSITKAVTIIGANAGDSGGADGRGAGESVIAGLVTVNLAVGELAISGVEFRYTGAQNSLIGSLNGGGLVQVSGAGTVRIEDSRFMTDARQGNAGVGLANPLDGGGDVTGGRALMVPTSFSGTLLVDGNYFSGTAAGGFSTASWRSGIWSDGSASTLRITNNEFVLVRAAANLDGYVDSIVVEGEVVGGTVVTGNTITNSGTGFSIGRNGDTSPQGIDGNVFLNVGTDFNLLNYTADVSFDVGTDSVDPASTTIAGTDLLQVWMGSGNDTVAGSAGKDWLIGALGNDSMVGEADNDSLEGGDGNDQLAGGAGDDVISGGNGVDTAVFGDGGVVVNLGTGRATGAEGNDTLSGIEGVISGNGNDELTGDDIGNALNGGGGNDTLSGGDGNDTLTGGAGGDSLQGGAGDEDRAIFADGTVLLRNFDGSFNAVSGNETDTLRGIELVEVGNDTILLADVIFAGDTIPGEIPIPDVTIVLDEDTGSDDLPLDPVTSNATVRGTGRTLTELTLTWTPAAPGAEPLTTTVTVDEFGNWTADAPALLPQGSVRVVASQTDGVGGTDSADIVFTFDTVDPGAPVSLDLETDTGRVGDDDVTKGDELTVSGFAEAGSTVSVFIDGGLVAVTPGLGESVRWTANLFRVPEGELVITATATDRAGNVSDISATLTVNVDQTAPDAPTITLDTDSGAGGDNLTNATLLVLSGEAEAGSVVTITRGTVELGEATVNGEGEWTFSDAGATADGAYTYSVVAEDLAGNVSDSAELTVTLDRTDPATPTIDLAAASDLGVSDSDNITAASALLFEGTAEGGSTVTLLRGGVAVGAATADGDTGAWSYILSGITASDTSDYSVTATDAAGNTSAASAPLTVEVDRDVPAAPLALDLVSDTGLSDTDDITAAGTLVISGNAEDGTLVEVFVNDVLSGSAIATGGNWTANVAPGVAEGSEGTVSITAKATDVAGNQSAASDPLTVVVDRIAPAAPTIGLVSDSNVAGDNVTNTTTILVGGTAAANAFVTIFRDGSAVGYATADGTGNWSYPDGDVGADGVFEYAATATDLAGNISDVSDGIEVTVDRTPPAAPVLVTATIDDATGSAITLTGTKEEGSGFTFGEVVGLAGTTFTASATALGSGPLVVAAQDLAGNTGAQSNAFTLVVGGAGAALSAGAGNQELTGNVGLDTLSGGEGDDTLRGGDGADSLVGGAGADSLLGGEGDDVLQGGAGMDTIDGGAGFDLVSYADALESIIFYLDGVGANEGPAAEDTLLLADIEGVIGTAFADFIFGDARANLLAGGGGDDVLSAGEGNDTLIGGAGADEMDGGDGFDVASYATAESGVIATLLTSAATLAGDAVGDLLSGIEGLFGSAFADSLHGNALNNLIEGGAGDDTIHGGNGADTLHGQDGQDILSYAASTTTVSVDLATNIVTGGHAAGDVISGFEGVIGGLGSDILTGNALDNLVSGLNGNDQLRGAGGADTLDGGTGNDTLRGGAGDDSLVGGQGRDLADYSDATGAVTVTFVSPGTGTGSASGDGIGNDIIASDIENIRGSAFDDTLTGANFVANLIEGGNGNDVIRGVGSADTLTGGNGADEFIFSSIFNSLGGTITDFSAAQGDRIDLVALDAIAGTGLNDAFTFVTGAFTAAGQVRAVQSGTNTLVELNTSGTDTAEVIITLLNVSAATVTASVFDL